MTFPANKVLVIGRNPQMNSDTNLSHAHSLGHAVIHLSTSCHVFSISAITSMIYILFAFTPDCPL